MSGGHASWYSSYREERGNTDQNGKWIYILAQQPPPSSKSTLDNKPLIKQKYVWIRLFVWESFVIANIFEATYVPWQKRLIACTIEYPHDGVPWNYRQEESSLWTNMERFPPCIIKWKKQNAKGEIEYSIYVRRRANTKTHTCHLSFVKEKYRIVKWETSSEIYYLQGEGRNWKEGLGMGESSFSEYTSYTILTSETVLLFYLLKA